MVTLKFNRESFLLNLLNLNYILSYLYSEKLSMDIKENYIFQKKTGEPVAPQRIPVEYHPPKIFETESFFNTE